ncbi:DUF4831 family protein [Natronoflexus pectinivorans]|uniref:Uncharacterized protein DUF4831 n=1 Tax=Natronoflexus pectinivorans TaxID=682526 RepID=A0A4R2GLN0_9BACT|nr:DUF4831 family protein [Natronoflexus pectinivorans]TCO09914.1 uncharacterized protein DUF4831 [Natronoflexus pectinivorans]
MKQIGLFLLIAILFGGCSSKETLTRGSVEQVNSDYPTGHGLWYYLPETVIQVEIIAEKTVARSGPFFRFSQRFLNVSDVITENKEEWRIVGAKVTTVGRPDKTRLFRVESSGNPSVTALTLSENGVLHGINLPFIPEVTTGVAKSDQPVISLADINFNDVPFTEEQLIRTSSTAMAEEVAREIYRLREMRSNILEGDVDLLPPDEGSYAIVMAEIDRKEQAYLELFTGRTRTQQVSRVYEFVPRPGKTLNTVLLRFSHQNGFLDSMDVSGTPVYIEVDVHEQAAYNFLNDEHDKSPNRRGMVYCYPVEAVVRIIDRTLLLNEQKVNLAQFGQLVRMPADLLDATNVVVEMDERTGAVKRISYK